MSKTLQKKLGTFLRVRIAEVKMTIPQVAKKSGLPLSVVQNVVAGRTDCRLSTLKKLCTTLTFKLVIWPQNPNCHLRLLY